MRKSHLALVYVLTVSCSFCAQQSCPLQEDVEMNGDEELEGDDDLESLDLPGEFAIRMSFS